MKILARGEKSLIAELKQKLAAINCEITEVSDSDYPQIDLAQFNVIFDLSIDEQANTLKYYAPLKNIPVFIGAVKKQLAEVVHHYGREMQCVLIGINDLPTFINRSLAEVSLYNSDNLAILQTTMQNLSWDFKLVGDRVGLVTPRIIMMIINEACYTLQEGTATMQDIDTSMKLGTNYPFGPFEWADKIGIKHVYETLTAIYNDTHDERYKICPLLKTTYLNNTSFYK
ncbi:MAG: 3-hydroxyacyl-CoA dehydrogenase [Bacteroidia bacterium]|nr:3-hydroxyacyl-CoA dehydrogenase [Bacteroidia bacterium]MBP9688179.1 3-hydroxyacyl-CoA dehydrogenase [Bacteroidia bacterium]